MVKGVRGSVVFWCSKICEQRQQASYFFMLGKLYDHWRRAWHYKPAWNAFVCKLVSKCRGEAAKWRPFQDCFTFYSEQANQKHRLIVSGPRKDAKPSVFDSS